MNVTYKQINKENKTSTITKSMVQVKLDYEEEYQTYMNQFFSKAEKKVKCAI